jgi:hypothetical protein
VATTQDLWICFFVGAKLGGSFNYYQEKFFNPKLVHPLLRHPFFEFVVVGVILGVQVLLPSSLFFFILKVAKVMFMFMLTFSLSLSLSSHLDIGTMKNSHLCKRKKRWIKWGAFIVFEN